MTSFDDNPSLHPSNLERHEQSREVLLHGAAGQAVVAVVLNAGLQSVRVTDTQSQVQVDSLASSVVRNWGRPRAANVLEASAPPEATAAQSRETPEAGSLQDLALHIVRNEVMTGLAASTAAHIYRRSVNLPSSNNDVPQQVIEVLDLIDGSDEEIDLVVTQWRTDTDNTLCDYWSVVEHVVEALRSGDILDEADVKDLVGPIEGDRDDGIDEDDTADLRDC